MSLLELIGFGNKTKKINEFIEKGAIVIDVRSPQEFKSGNIKGSKNIPLQTISSKIEDIKKLNKPVITCCLSGMRSAQAATILKRNEIDCMNGGGWNSLNKKI